MGIFAGNLLHHPCLGMWVRPQSFGPSCAGLLCPGQSFLTPEKTHGTVGTKGFLAELKEGTLEGGPGVCPWKSQWEERKRVYHSCRRRF